MDEYNNFQDRSSDTHQEDRTDKKRKAKTPEEKALERRTLFCKNAQPRVNRVISTLDELAGIAGSDRYEYTQENADKMFKAIEDALAHCKEKYANNMRVDREEFVF